MEIETIADPVFGDHGRLFRYSRGDWAAFTIPFGTPQQEISIFVDVENGRIPASQHELFKKIVRWYPENQEIWNAISDQVKIEGLFDSAPSTNRLKTMFQVVTLSIRTANQRELGRDWGWGFTYRFDSRMPDLYVTMSDDFQVKYCGLKD